MKIHLIPGFRKERILAEMYAKLIGPVLFQFLSVPLLSEDIDLSPVKAFKLLNNKAGLLINALLHCNSLKNLIEKLHRDFLTHAKREKRKKRLSTFQQLRLIGDCNA